MREIKFSYIAQHDETGRFMEQIFTMEQIEGGNFISQWIEKFPRWYITNRRQFTGLKDKNKEIYEGDIVHVIHYDYAEGHGKVKTGERHYAVSYDEGMAGYLPFVDGSCPTDIDSDYGDWEVVGNIYANPELLKGESNES